MLGILFWPKKVGLLFVKIKLFSFFLFFLLPAFLFFGLGVTFIGGGGSGGGGGGGAQLMISILSTISFTIY